MQVVGRFLFAPGPEINNDNVLGGWSEKGDNFARCLDMWYIFIFTVKDLQPVLEQSVLWFTKTLMNPVNCAGITSRTCYISCFVLFFTPKHDGRI